MPTATRNTRRNGVQSLLKQPRLLDSQWFAVTVISDGLERGTTKHEIYLTKSTGATGPALA